MSLNEENGTDGHASLGFYDAAENQRIVVGDGASPQGQEVIGVFFSVGGNQVVSLSSTASGEVNITLYDNKTGLACAGLDLAADATRALALFDQREVLQAEYVFR